MPCEAGGAQVPATPDERVPVRAPVDPPEGIFLHPEALGKFLPVKQFHTLPHLDEAAAGYPARLTISSAPSHSSGP